MTGSDCAGEWRTPVGCTTNCDYHATWSYMEKSDEIEFFIETRAPANWWTAIGFAETPTMVRMLVKGLFSKEHDTRLDIIFHIIQNLEKLNGKTRDCINGIKFFVF